MFNTLTRRQNWLEETNVAMEEKAKRLEEEVHATSSNLSKVSEDLAIAQSLHVETTKVLEQTYVELKEANDALAEAQERLRVAEEQNSKLTKEVNTKDQEIDKILSKAKSSEEKYEQLVAAMQLEKELFRRMCSKLPQDWIR